MQISKNKVVSLHYILHNDNANGDIIEQTNETSPLVFIYGVGQMLPVFEKNLELLKAGDSFSFTLTSAEAYGEYDPNAIIELDKKIFEYEGKVDEKLIALGNIIPMRDDQGHVLQGKVIGVNDNSVRMDFNHPMAGKTLHFIGSIAEVREATEEELGHGHVHGDGCCNHC